jgi:hypothetical protein
MVSVIAGLACMAALAGVAPAAGTSVSIKVKGSYARRAASACGKRHSFRLFHKGGRIEVTGFVTPASARHFPFSVEIGKCSGHRFRGFHTYGGRGKKATGKYKLFLGARGLGSRSHRRSAVVYYFARVHAAGGISKKVYFGVTQ